MPVIAQDLGGTKLITSLLSDEGEIMHSETALLDKRKGTEVGALVVNHANSILHKAIAMNARPSALGICVPGIAHAKTGTVWAPNIPGWDEYPLKDEFEKGLSGNQIAVRIDSDRTCYILGEVWKGNARGCSDAIYLSVGTGIGAGIIINKQVLRGAYDIGGAIGWMALSKPFEEKFISCGCFEYNASGDGIAKVAREWLEAGIYPETSLQHVVPDQISASHVFDACNEGDRLSVAVINNAIEYLGMAVANLISIFNPEKIILGGGVFGPGIPYIPDIFREAKKWAQPISITQVSLDASALGNKAGILGAGYLALKDQAIT